MALHGAADAAFKIYLASEGQIAVECKKLKDAPPPPLMLFNRREIPLQIGDVEDRSFVLDLAAEGEDAVKIAKPKEAVKLNKEREQALEVLRQLCKRYFEENTSVTHVPYKEWRTECLKTKIYKRSDNFNRTARALYGLKLVTYDDVTKTVYIDNEML